MLNVTLYFNTTGMVFRPLTSTVLFAFSLQVSILGQEASR